MSNMVRPFAILLITLTASCTKEDAVPRGPTAEKAMAVVERSKSTKATYAVYTWNRITPPGTPPVEEWAAEFHSGTMHRVETPRDRIIADCAAQTGTHRSLIGGQTMEGKEVALMSCGINTNNPFVEADWIKRVKTRFGDADRIRLVDAGNVRHYDVSDQGVLINSTIASNTSDEALLLAMETVALSGKLPESDMFSQESLKRSVVPEEYRRAPAAGR
jgi:hypothetical protein